MYLASELEKPYTKSQILEKDRNAVYFGGGAYGAEAAAREYFGKHANELTLAEASLLALLPARAGRTPPLPRDRRHRGRVSAPSPCRASRTRPST